MASLHQKLQRRPGLTVTSVEPRQALLRKVLLFAWLKVRGLIERTNMEMRLRRPGQALTSQSGTASGAKATARLPWGRIELGYLAFGKSVSLKVIKREDRDRCTGMPSTALTMAPIYRLGLPGRDKTDCTT